jgi:hypothetical protein
MAIAFSAFEAVAEQLHAPGRSGALRNELRMKVAIICQLAHAFSWSGCEAAEAPRRGRSRCAAVPLNPLNKFQTHDGHPEGRPLCV